MAKSFVAVTIGLLAASVAASPVAAAEGDPSLGLGFPADGIPIPDLVLYPPGYDKNASLDARGYAPTCSRCEINSSGSGATLTCRCTNTYGNPRDSNYDLNRCIGNSDGNLLWWVNGGFGGSCWSATLGGTTLSATCRTNGGGSRGTGINLDEHLQNWDGFIGCDFS